ncbi:hypothetical protein K8I28_01135 [bacterium]|nr:hypothetical protein [bacterium]
MAFKPSQRRKAPDETVEPNITPIMNLMVVLIPMLLSVAQFVQLSLLEYTPPPAEQILDGEGGEGEGGGEVQNLDLLLNIAEGGFEVSVFNETKGDNFKEIPLLPDGTYDFEALHREMLRIKTDIVGPPVRVEEQADTTSQQVSRLEIFKYADANRIKISAQSQLPWQVLVQVLDETRNYRDPETRMPHPLFPLPLLGQIQ